MHAFSTPEFPGRIRKSVVGGSATILETASLLITRFWGRLVFCYLWSSDAKEHWSLPGSLSYAPFQFILLVAMLYTPPPRSFLYCGFFFYFPSCLAFSQNFPVAWHVLGTRVIGARTRRDLSLYSCVFAFELTSIPHHGLAACQNEVSFYLSLLAVGLVIFASLFYSFSFLI